MPPGVHPAPADLALGSQLLAEIPGDRRGFLEGVGDHLLVRLGILGPVARRTRGVDADHAIRPDASLAQLTGDPARLANGRQVILSLLLISHRRGVEPDRRYHRSDHEPLGRNLIGNRFQIVVADVDVDVRLVEENVDSVKLDAVDLGGGGQLEHRVEVNKRFSARAPFADQAGPHGVVQFRKRVGMAAAHGMPLSVRGKHRHFPSCLLSMPVAAVQLLPQENESGFEALMRVSRTSSSTLRAFETPTKPISSGSTAPCLTNNTSPEPSGFS